MCDSYLPLSYRVLKVLLSDTRNIVHGMKKPKHAKSLRSPNVQASKDVKLAKVGIAISVFIWLFGDPVRDLLWGLAGKLCQLLLDAS